MTNIYSTHRWHGGDKTAVRGSVVSALAQRLCPEGSGKGDYSDLPKVPYCRCKRTTDRLVQGKTDLCQGICRPRTSLPAVTRFQLGFDVQAVLCVYLLCLSLCGPPCGPLLSLSGLACGPFSVHIPFMPYPLCYCFLFSPFRVFSAYQLKRSVEVYVICEGSIGRPLCT